MELIQRMLRLTDSNAAVEISTATDGQSQNIRITGYTDQDFVIRVVEAAGYRLAANSAESAHFGVLDFTNEPLSDNSETAFDESDNDGLDKHEISILENRGSRSPIRLLGELSSVPIDGDGRAFVVLTDDAAHKFAMKVYTQMLGNTDMSKYGAFLYDLDNFLQIYYNPPDDSADDEDDTDDDTDDSADAGDDTEEPSPNSVTVPDMPAQGEADDDDGSDDEDPDNSDDDKKSEKAHVKPGADVASLFFAADGEKFYQQFKEYLPETAGKYDAVVKTIIGIIINIIVGALGRALLVAWGRKDKGMFESLLYKIVKYMLSDYFPVSPDDEQKYSKYYDDYRSTYGYNQTIDVDDYRWDYEGASAELIGVDIESLEEAGITNKLMTRMIISVFIKLMATYIGHRVVDAWVRRDANAFRAAMGQLITRALDYFPSNETAGFDEEIEAETAKKNNPRSQFLSAMMKALSGPVGDQAAKAWDEGDPESLGDAMGKAAEKVLFALPVDEDKYGKPDAKDAEDYSESDDDDDTSDDDDGSEDASVIVDKGIRSKKKKTTRSEGSLKEEAEAAAEEEQRKAEKEAMERHAPEPDAPHTPPHKGVPDIK